MASIAPWLKGTVCSDFFCWDDGIFKFALLTLSACKFLDLVEVTYLFWILLLLAAVVVLIVTPPSCSSLVLLLLSIVLWELKSFEELYLISLPATAGLSWLTSFMLIAAFFELLKVFKLFAANLILMS